MPLTPPDFQTGPGFDPVFVTDEDLADLSSFTGMTVEECLERLRTYSPREIAEAWRRADPHTEEELVEFYRAADLYVWELMQWHAGLARRPYWEALEHLTQRFPPQAGYRRVLDFGCGVGTDGLFLASRGYEVTLVDVESPALKFARHRAERHGLPVRVIESRSSLPERWGEFDVVVCFDVFEHLPNPLAAARRLLENLRMGGLMVQSGGFGWHEDHPCHLEDGSHRFRGRRWDIHLAAIGLLSEGSLILRKVGGVARGIQWLRYAVWKVSGVWFVKA